jgi:hypothetical protein
VLGHVERDAEQATQLNEPRVVGLRVSEGPAADRAAAR